jgi:hypothetical protein
MITLLLALLRSRPIRIVLLMLATEPCVDCKENNSLDPKVTATLCGEPGEWVIELEPGDLISTGFPPEDDSYWDEQLDEQYDIYYIDGENLETETGKATLEKVCDLIVTGAVSKHGE